MTVEMNNAAFADESEVTFEIEDGDRKVPTSEIAAGMELARILRYVADGCETGFEVPTVHGVRDANGNTVGRWSVVDDETDDEDRDR